MKLRLVALRPSLLRPFSATTKNASSSVAAIDWQRVLDNTASPARSFVLDARSRHEDVLRLLADLRKSQVVIDFEKYRQRGVEEEVLREVEGEISAWKEPPLSADKDHKAKLETLQMRHAEEHAKDLEAAIEECRARLQALESAKPVDLLTIDDVYRMNPELRDKIYDDIRNDRWGVDDDATANNNSNADGASDTKSSAH